MNTTLRKIGNSEGIIIPKEVVERLGLKTGDQFEIVENGKDIALRPVDDTFERQMQVAREVMEKYKVALKKLAE